MKREAPHQERLPWLEGGRLDVVRNGDKNDKKTPGQAKQKNVVFITVFEKNDKKTERRHLTKKTYKRLKSKAYCFVRMAKKAKILI